MQKVRAISSRDCEKKQLLSKHVEKHLKGIFPVQSPVYWLLEIVEIVEIVDGDHKPSRVARISWNMERFRNLVQRSDANLILGCDLVVIFENPEVQSSICQDSNSLGTLRREFMAVNLEAM